MSKEAGRLPDQIASFLNHLSVERGLSSHTIAAYRRDLTKYQQFCQECGISTIGEVGSTEISGFLVQLAYPRTPEGTRARTGDALLKSQQDSLQSGEDTADSGLAPDGQRPGAAMSVATVARVAAAVRSFHKFAHMEGWTATDPAEKVKAPSLPRRLPKAVSVAEVESIIAAAASDPDSTTALRNVALIELLYATGARISEVLALDVDDFPEPDEGLRLLGKGGKYRVVPVGSMARAAVGEYLAVRANLVSSRRACHALFLNARGGRLSRQSAFGILQAAGNSAGLTVEVSPHTLRHSCASHLLDGGADVRVVQELLGHASVATTQIYTLITVNRLAEEYATSHPRAR